MSHPSRSAGHDKHPTPDSSVTLAEFLSLMARRETIVGGSPAHRFMHGAAQEALAVTAELNSGYRFQDTGGITIGAGSLIGHGCTFTTLNHSMDPARRADMEPAPITVGRKVWFGASVTVVPGVTLGDGAVIGAGSVVTKDVPANTIVAGVPARIIRETGFEA